MTTRAPSTSETHWMPIVLAALSTGEGRSPATICRQIGVLPSSLPHENVRVALRHLETAGLARRDSVTFGNRVRWFLTAKGEAARTGAASLPRPAGAGREA